MSVALKLTDIAHAMKVWKNLLGKGDKIHANEIAVAPGLLLGDALGDSGSNANGSWIKLHNGLLICQTSIDSSLKNNVAGNGLVNHANLNSPGDLGNGPRNSLAWAFPIIFVGTPTVLPSFAAVNVNSDFGMVRHANVLSSTPTTVGNFLLINADINGTAIRHVRGTVTAIGFWK